MKQGQTDLSFHRYVEFEAPAARLDDHERIIEVLREGATRMGSKVLDESWHKFEPQGVTVLLLLSTSHIAIHTWPEHEMAQLDVLSCNKDMPVDPAIEFMVKALEGKITTIRKAHDEWPLDKAEILKGSGVTPSEETPGHPYFRTFGILTPFGDKIMPLFPKEAPETYAELFCGNIEMLWCHQKRAKLEVVNDLDKDIVRLHRICQSMSDDSLEKLAKMEWTSSEGMFDRLVKQSTPKGDLDFFHRELYIRRFSKFGRAKPRYAEFSKGGIMQPIKRIQRCRSRLKGVEISNRDYRDAIKKYDSPGTFWEIDPPYPEEGGYYPFKMPDLGEQADHYMKLKGKAIIIIEGSRESLKPLIEMKGWKEYKFRWPRKWYGTPGGPAKPFVLASMFVNYDPPGKTKKSAVAWDVGDTMEKDRSGLPKPSEETPMWPWFKTFGMLGRFANKILPTFPATYKTYVEVFCGNGEMLWCHKKQAETEVINDLDPDIVRLHRMCQNLTDEQLEKLQKDFDWVGREKTFHKMAKQTAPKDDLGWLHRQLYLRRFSKWGIQRLGQFYEISEGSSMNPFERIKRCRSRMEGVKVENMDYRKVIDKYDGPDTLFFLDPPYPEESGLYKFPLRDVEEQAKVYQNIKGKAVIVIQGRHKSLDPLRNMPGWHEKNFRWPRMWYGKRTDDHIKSPFYVASIFTNFKPTQKSMMEPDPDFIFEMIDASVEKLHIGEVIPSVLRNAPDDEILSTNRRLHQLFGANFRGNDKISVGDLNRENLVNAAIFVWDEMRRRGMTVNEDTELWHEVHNGGALSKDLGERETAPILPGSEGGLPPIDPDDVLAHHDKPIVLRAPFVSLVGSICNQNETRNDIDMLLQGKLSPEMRQVVEFRLRRSLPPDMSERVQIHDDDLGGPFTDHVSVYDLVMVPSHDRKIVRMSLEKQDDNIEYPKSFGQRKGVIQIHTRGATAHFDFRALINDHLIGWTFFAQIPGQVSDINTVEGARKLYDGWTAEKGNGYLKPVLAPSKLQGTPKLPQPKEWLDISGKVIGEGEVGATTNQEGVIVAVARPLVEWGIQEQHFHEYFLTGDKEWHGPLYLRRIIAGKAETPEGKPYWTAHLSKGALPSILTQRSVDEKRMPPVGQSAMPSSLMSVTPKAYRFWEESSADSARKVRDELVASGFFTEQNVKLVDGKFSRITTKSYIYLSDEKDSVVEDIGKSGTDIDINESSGHMPILKTKDEQYVLGVVLEPNDGKNGAPLSPDSQDDIYSKDEIRQAAHRFMADFRNVGLMHRTLVNGKVQILESYLSPIDFYVSTDGTAYSNPPSGEGAKLQKVRAGTWLLGLRVVDKELWNKVKRNELTGLSIGGSARRVSESNA